MKQIDAINWRPVLNLLLGMMTLAFLACSSGDTSKADGGDDTDGNQCPVICQSTDDCCGEDQCIDGVCTSPNACPTGCNYECDKTKNQICNEATKMCEVGAPPLNCVDDCDCYTNETCSGGACVPSTTEKIPCTTETQSEDCPTGQKCVDNFCQPSACETRADCAGATCLICKSGECTAPPPVCRGDDDCCVGFHCNFGTCIPDSSGCQSDSDCEEPYPHCDNKTSECVYECLVAEDCAQAGEQCVDNHCIVPGCTPESCDKGQWCDTGAGTCKSGCDSNDDCTPPDTCNYSTHQCGQTDCCGGLCDPGSQYCDSLTCTCVDQCATDADCREGFECKPSGNINKCWCTENACPNGTQCQLDTGECVAYCQTSDDCPAGFTCNLATNECESSVPGADGGFCFSDDDCDAANGLLCDNCLLCPLFLDFFPTFTCRYKCGLITQQCPVGNRECEFRRIMEDPNLGITLPTGLCVEPAP